MSMSYQRVGVVQALYRYPVKSMAGELVETAHIGWHGIEGDRRYAFARTGQLVGFPWLTASKLPELLSYTPRYLAPHDPRSSAVEVQTPDGHVLDIGSDALRTEVSERYGAPVHMMRLDQGIFDAFSLSLISQETVQALETATERELVMARFRPNIVITTLTGESFCEDGWVGKRLVFGERADAPTMKVNERDVRCVMVNIDPQTLVKDAAILKTIAQTRQNCLGIYGSTDRIGMIEIGAPVYLAA